MVRNASGFGGTILLLLVAWAGWEAVDALRDGTPVFDRNAVQIFALVSFQWLMVVPHELGHAALGALAGYRRIRIVIGSGSTIASMSLFGMPWLFGSVPFGGVTLATPPHGASRWRQLAFIGGGPGVSVVAALGAWAVSPSRFAFDGDVTVLELFFWANVVVLVENLWPHVAVTPSGQHPTDGLQLVRVALHGRHAVAGDPGVERAGSGLVQRMLVALVLAVALLVSGLAGIAVARLEAPVGAKVGVVAGVVLGASFLAWKVIGVLRERPWRPAKVEEPLAVRAWRELESESPWLATGEDRQLAREIERGDLDAADERIERALLEDPEDPVLLLRKAEVLYARGRHAEAEATAPTGRLGRAAWQIVLSARVKSALRAGHAARAQALVDELLASEVALDDKVEVLDVLASDGLESSPVQGVSTLTAWMRRALEMAPESTTLKGTLGALLAEQGAFAEAEPLLRECHAASGPLHDRGIAALYLAQCAHARGATAEAALLAREATTLHDAPWLARKARRYL